jgi:hypothetical protein
MCISRFIRILAKYFEVPEPVRDVSFILDKRERAVLEEAIGTVNSMKGGWDSLRNPHFSPDSLLAAQIKNSLKHPSHTEDTLSATMYLLKHMAHNWDDWVARRTKTQVKDEENRNFLEKWVNSHMYTATTNRFILTSYLENLLENIEEWNVADKQGSGAEHLILSIQSAIVNLDVESLDSFKEFVKFEGGNVSDFEKTNDYKVEVYKKFIELEFPSDYELCEELCQENIRFMKDSEAAGDIRVEVDTLRHAMQMKNLDILQKAMRGPPAAKLSKLRRTPEYLVAIGLEQELLQADEEFEKLLQDEEVQKKQKSKDE